MRNAMRHLIATGLLLFAIQSISAQKEVLLDHVTNSIGDTALAAGNTHILNFRYRNVTTGRCQTASWETNNGFRLFSPDGATWNRSSGSFTRNFFLAAIPFWSTLIVNHFNDPISEESLKQGDGVSPDYIGFISNMEDAAPPGTGMTKGFNDIAMTIEIQSNIKDTGLIICIDSSSAGKLNVWGWSAIDNNDPVCNRAIGWGGPYCFKVIDAPPDDDGGGSDIMQEIILDHVTNSIDDSMLVAGNTHLIILRARNFPLRQECASLSYSTSNGFVFFSPDGATWDHAVGKITTSFIDAGAPWLLIGVNHFEDVITPGDTRVPQGDGISPDYLQIFAIGAAFIGPGLPSGFDDPAFTFEIATNLADTNLHICLDKSELGKLNTWSWAARTNVIECSISPDWGGPYCFKIVQATATCGDTDFDGQVTDFDLDFLIEYYFAFGPPPDLRAADVNGDGTIDISDIIYLANYLHNNGPAPCAGTGPGGFDWKDKPDTRQAGND